MSSSWLVELEAYEAPSAGNLHAAPAASGPRPCHESRPIRPRVCPNRSRVKWRLGSDCGKGGKILERAGLTSCDVITEYDGREVRLPVIRDGKEGKPAAGLGISRAKDAR